MEKFKDGKVFIWMQLLGFDRDDPDRGANRYLKQTGFIPDGIFALLFHPDFVHLHQGMSDEYELSANICAYHGIPRNRERERQPWTNYNLRDLVQNLNKKGIGMYASIMGASTDNNHHREWINDHRELERHSRGGGRWGHCILKRFKDGSLYEDFFIEQLCITLTDYGLRGIHLADGFCANGNLYHGDYSTDLVTQFLDHICIELPDEIISTLGNDTAEVEDYRGDWIWSNVRSQWIEFMCWRWEQFFVKLCSAVHEIGCEVTVLGMYCTDPFETKYCLGLDLARIMDVGVDYLTANIMAAGCYIANPWGSEENFFHRYMAIAPTTAAHIKKGHLISMLGVQDATEEYDIMKHAPCIHERDIYTMMAYQLIDKFGIRRALEGYMICLGDGIKREDWLSESEKMEVALSADVKQVISPVMLWSDTAYDKMLDEYIKTRRWTPFKHFYEMGKAGTMCGACITSDAISSYSGTLFVPNFDMLSPKEQQKIVEYKTGAVICTVTTGFDLCDYDIQPTIHFSDIFSDYSMVAFSFGMPLSDNIKEKINTLLTVNDDVPDIAGNPSDLEDYTYTLVDTLPFAKVSAGFIDALALVLKESSGSAITCSMPYLAFVLQNDAWRIYIFNNVEHQYRYADVSITVSVADVRIVSSFPVLPVRYINVDDINSKNLIHDYTKQADVKQNFQVKLLPGGVTIVDVFLKK